MPAQTKSCMYTQMHFFVLLAPVGDCLMCSVLDLPKQRVDIERAHTHTGTAGYRHTAHRLRMLTQAHNRVCTH